MSLLGSLITPLTSSGGSTTGTINQLLANDGAGGFANVNVGSGLNYNTGTNTLTATGGGGSSAFNDITSGTNTSAAMVVGTGASLAASGSGTIAATTVATNANLTGPVTSVGNATSITDNAITNAKLAQVSTQTFKGRTTASTGDVEDLTATQATAILNAMVGDSGTGGTKGLVPAPASGDAAAGKFLKADGSWTAPAGTGDVVGPASATNNAVSLFDTITGKLLKNSAVTVSGVGLDNLNAAGATLSGLTASELMATDGSKNVQSLDTATYPSLTEISYVKGVTSAIQTQLADKQTTTLADTNILVGNASNVATAVAVSGDATLANTGALTIANNAVTTTKIADANVTLAKIANAAANDKLLGSGAAGSGSPYVEITLGTNLSMSGTTLNAANLERFSGQSGAVSATKTSGIACYEFTGAGSLVLPTAVGNSALFMVKNRHSANITVTFTGGQNADGSTSISIAPYQALQFVSNNSNYNIF